MAEAARSILEKVQVTKRSIQIRLCATGLKHELGFTASAAADFKDPTDHPPSLHRNTTMMDPLEITLTSHLLRCGKQIKLVLSQDPTEPVKANPHLIDMVGKTRRWFDGLTSGRYQTLRSIANEEQCDKSYVSRLLSVAFLAPDIVERILTGNHKATLTPERLRKACPLPVGWDEQRALLID
jgi:hypothetical protein